VAIFYFIKAGFILGFIFQGAVKTIKADTFIE